ncbi:MAG: Maf family protein [Woeseia sp.]
MSVGLAGRAVETTSVVLASSSRVRARLLENAGVMVIPDPPGVDEQEIKGALRAEGASPASVVEALAELKALRVSLRHRGALVVGADQMLVCGGTWFDKPADSARARADLMALRGRTHELICGACVARDGMRLWHHLASARLTMRSFSDEFIDGYLETLGEAALDSVGVYQLEGLGTQLFSQVDGDFFTILGLPMLPLLAFLRDHEVVAQ